MKKLKLILLFIIPVLLVACKKDAKDNVKDKLAKSESKFEQVVKTIPVLKLPYEVKELSASGKSEFSKEQLVELQLKSLPSHAEHFKYYPFGLISKTKNYLSLLILQDYTEESFAWLINYSPEGKLLDKLKVYYDNSEGSVWTQSKINQQEVEVLNGVIDENQGKPVSTWYQIGDQGKFIKIR